jgi:hypothetical protein
MKTRKQFRPIEKKIGNIFLPVQFSIFFIVIKIIYVDFKTMLPVLFAEAREPKEKNGYLTADKTRILSGIHIEKKQRKRSVDFLHKKIYKQQKTYSLYGNNTNQLRSI